MAVLNNSINYSLGNFSAYLSSSQGFIPPTGPTIIKFDSTYLNDGANYNTGTYTYTVPISGTYLINTNLYLTVSFSTDFELYLYINGSASSTIFECKPTSGGLLYVTGFSSSYVASFTAGQALTFYFQVVSGSGGSTIAAGSNVTGILLI